MTTLALDSQSDGDIQPLKHLMPAEMDAAAEAAKSFDLRDSNAVSSFGSGAQQGMAALADPLLKAVATKDSGTAGEALTNLMTQVKALDTRSLLTQSENALARLPAVGHYFSKLHGFLSRYQKIDVVIDRIVVALDNARNDLNRDIALLDHFYDQNTACFRQLLVYVAAGEMKLEELRTAHTQAIEEARASADPIASQRAADVANTISRLERRLHDLRLSAMVALQSAPQLRLIQNGDQALVEKIQTSITVTIPMWKTQVAMAITQLGQLRAAQLQREIAETTKKMLMETADRTRTASAAAQREAERGLVDLQTLQHTHDQLLASIEDSLRIQAEGRQQRRAAEAQLDRMQKEWRAKLEG